MIVWQHMKQEDKKTIFILGALIIICIIIWLGILSLVSTVAHAEAADRKETHDKCVLDANNKYANSIKVQGTPMFISGKDVSGLSTEQWQLINNQRLEDIKNCPKV
jgi:hypothetical protein